MLDEPAKQRRRTLALDMQRDGSLLVYGASGSGKTVLLQTLARALAERSAPRELQLYGLDYASGALGAIEALPQCGSVIRGDEEERVLRLLGGLGRALAQRKQGAAGARPQIVLLLDGYGAFAAALERVG
jgi:S-DNA-T family DNA segregation ATPase FtsK/SpoIIIE